MRIALIVNAHSRHGAGLFDDAQRALAARGADIVLAEAASRPDRIPGAIRAAAERGADRVLLGGGDGTLSSSCRLFSDLDLTMAVLPLGTANSFARTVGVPLDLEGAVDLALSGQVDRIDLGRLGDHYFTNAAAVGLPAEIGRTVPDWLKRVFGRFAYVLWGAWKLLGFHGFRCTVTYGDERRVYEVVELRVLNGRFLGGMKVTARAKLEDHEIVLQLVSGTHNWELARAWAHLAAGEPPDIGEITELSARHFHIETVPPQPVSIDGEVLARTPAEAEVASGVLKLVVPLGGVD